MKDEGSLVRDESIKSKFNVGFSQWLARIDNDGDCVVKDDITVVVAADPGKDVFKIYDFFPGASGTLEQALQFCNRFNLHLLVCRAQVRDTPDSDGSWTVVFDYDRLTFEDEELEPRTIVRLVRRFQQIVRSGALADSTRMDCSELSHTGRHFTSNAGPVTLHRGASWSRADWNRQALPAQDSP